MITLVFFALLFSTAYMTYMVYLRGVTHFEDLPNVIFVGESVKEDPAKKETVVDEEDPKSDKNSELPSKKERKRRIIEREVENDQEEIDGDEGID